MTDEGYRARIYAVEWHANLWRVNGVPIGTCEQMMQHCTECVESDYYGDPRPVSGDPWSSAMEHYLDTLFSDPHNLVSFD